MSIKKKKISIKYIAFTTHLIRLRYWSVFPLMIIIIIITQLLEYYTKKCIVVKFLISDDTYIFEP